MIGLQYKSFQNIKNRIVKTKLLLAKTFNEHSVYFNRYLQSILTILRNIYYK